MGHGLELTQENVGVLAEYHALSGIDDFALVESMKRDGLDIVQHTRYADAIYGFFRLILSLLRRPTSFKLLLRRRG